MDFNVVEVPNHSPYKTLDPVISALTKNIGKAIEVELGERDPNAYRKVIRSGLTSRGILATHKYHSQVDNERKTIIMWLEPKEAA